MRQPRWSGASFLFYVGATVVLLATLALIATLTAQADGHRPAVAAGWSALACALALAAAFAARRRHAVPAGLAAFLALLFLGALAAALVTWAGLGSGAHGFLQRGWAPGAYLVEAAIVVGGLALLRTFAFPLLALPVAAVLLYAFVDVATSILGGDRGTGVPSLFAAIGGLALIAAAVRSEPRPVAFWLHLLGGAAFGGSLFHLAQRGEAGWFAVLVGALAYVFACRALGRSSYAVLAAIGVFAVASHWIATSFDVAVGVPFLGSGLGSAPEPWHVALGYVATGLAIALLGLLASRREEPHEVGGQPAERLELDGA